MHGSIGGAGDTDPVRRDGTHAPVGETHRTEPAHLPAPSRTSGLPHLMIAFAERRAKTTSSATGQHARIGTFGAEPQPAVQAADPNPTSAHRSSAPERHLIKTRAPYRRFGVHGDRRR
jgi:hypothetical protein